MKDGQLQNTAGNFSWTHAILKLSDADTMHFQTQNKRIAKHLNATVSCLTFRQHGSYI